MEPSQTHRTKGELTKIILCVFYCPPKTPIKVRNELVQHISKNLEELRLKHPSARTIISGDRNQLPVKELLKIAGNLKQIVDKPTRKGKILDVILTDIQHLLKGVTIVPPVPVDDGESGMPSDHNGVLVEPLQETPRKKDVYKVIEVQPMSRHKLNEIGCVLTNEK